MAEMEVQLLKNCVQSPQVKIYKGATFWELFDHVTLVLSKLNGSCFIEVS